MTITTTPNLLPINKPWIGLEEQEEVNRVLEENAMTTAARNGGKRVQEFESLLRQYLGCKYAIAVNSGTAALQASLMAADIGPGDEVLLPSFTFVATANAVLSVGARPIFVDIKSAKSDSPDMTIDIRDLERKVSPWTKAIIPVHLYGHPCDMDQIGEIATKFNIPIIEDACQSLGSRFKGKQTGTFGATGCFSFYASKVITAGEGGAIVTDDSELAERLLMIRNHGMVEGYDTRRLGLNLRLPEMCAAVAKVQMGKLNTILEMRRKRAEILSELISRRLKGFSIPVESPEKTYNWYLYTINFGKASDREEAKKHLAEQGIGAAVYYDPPVHLTPYYATNYDTTLAETEYFAKRVLSLPVHPGVSERHLWITAKALLG